MNEKTTYTKFDELIENNKIIDTGLIYVDVMNICKIEDIEFKKLIIYDNKIKYKCKLNRRDVEIPLQDIANGLEKITIMFSNCIFNDETNFFKKIDYSFVFESCKFDSLKFNHIKINEHPNYKDFKSNFEFVMVKINKKLIINDCQFSGKFYINNQKYVNHPMSIDSVQIKESTFNENFKLHNCDISNIELSNIDFEKNADFFKSKFLQKNKNIAFNGINIKGISILEECEFYSKFIMQYVTLNGLVQFRSAKFYNGLDLDRTNTEKPMNFYNVKGLEKISKNNDTSQETYRILKHHCEKMGNVIDANMYHALELEKKKETLEKENKVTQESIVFWFNWITSKFGTDYIRPIIGIVILGFFTLLILHGDSIVTLLNKPTLIEFLQYIGKGINQAFGYMYILNKDEIFQKCGVVFLFNKVLLGYLYYQFVTAVRKDTRK
jgi:hypothetical protein